MVSQNGDEEYWAADDLQMDETTPEELQSQAWGIEVYHRGMKPCCGIERAQVREAATQRNHLLYGARAFLRLEMHKLEQELVGIRERCPLSGRQYGLI